MIYKRTGVPIFVDPDRVRAVKELISQHECDVVVSEDGLQHYTLGSFIAVVPRLKSDVLQRIGELLKVRV